MTTKKTKKGTGMAVLPMVAIIESPDNYRTEFDGAAMEELAASIKEKGVLQPIVVRPDADGFEIVCGARRYRAAIMAGLEEIPAIVRELDDREAVELRLIENVQRRDVHPMDEASAFLNLVDTHKLDREEIALRVGKSGKYVAQRLKLNDLIVDFQEMFFRDCMGLADAVQLSRISSGAQEDILKEKTGGKDWRETEGFRLGNLGWYLERAARDLYGATFETEDADLYPEAGACGNCPHNSANSPLLFTDMQGRNCTHPLCFAVKTERAFKNELEAVMADPEVLIVNTSWGNDSDNCKAAREAGAEVLGRGSFTVLEKPERPGTLEEFIKREGCYDEEEMEEAKDDYLSASETYVEDLREYSEERASGNVRKAFVVEGYGDAGRYIEVVLNGGAIAAQTPGDSETERILAREKRARELDGEKVYKAICEELRANSAYRHFPGKLEIPERLALALMLEGFSGYGDRKFFREEGLESVGTGDWAKKRLFEELTEKLTPELLNKIVRNVLLNQLITGTEMSPERHGKAMAIIGIAERYLPERVKEIRLEQAEKAAKRADRVKKRIEGLKAKKDAKESADNG